MYEECGNASPSKGHGSMASWDVSRAQLYGAGGSVHVFPKDTNNAAKWPHSGGACTEREMQRQSGETWSEGLKDVHESWGCVLRVVLQSRRRLQKIVPRRRLLRCITMEAASNLWEHLDEPVRDETNRSYWVLCGRREGAEHLESIDQDCRAK